MSSAFTAQFANAPDGSLYVLDVYREVIEHPRSLPPEASVAGHPPGTITAIDAEGILVQCGAGVLRLTRLQAEGGSGMAARAFLNGHPMHAGDRLTAGT